MAYTIREIGHEEFPPLLKEIPDKPNRLFCAGSLPEAHEKILTIVGSRRFTPYGKQACEKIISGLAGYPIVIVSGLALGTDSIAHNVALKHRIKTIAVPGSGLSPSVIYPRSHLNLAERIIEEGGGLLSEFPNDFRATLWSFPKRNRIMAGMSHATLVIEASEKSGTLITSRLATEYNRDVCTVPQSIFSQTSAGPHMLMRLGATPITKSEDILEMLGIPLREQNLENNYADLTEAERNICKLLSEPKSRDELIRESRLPAWEINSILVAMELKGIIKESMGEIHLIS
jgi:DNA processing protein